VIPFTDPAKALRSPENAYCSPPMGEKRPEPVPGADRAAPAALLRSPYGLPPQHGGTPTLLEDNTHPLSQQVDR
jgi:hypothetical protein